MVRPLNVLYGGQASPQDGGAATDAKGAIERFILRQSEVVCAKRDGGVTKWWDAARWNRELTTDLVNVGVHEAEAKSIAEEINARALAEYAAGRSATPGTVTTMEVES